MSLYQELSTSVEKIISNANESAEFKGRFSKLIENYLDSSYQDNDISELIELVELPEDTANGD